jgi:Putative type VII ESX secretion system translocon, EccE
VSGSLNEPLTVRFGRRSTRGLLLGFSTLRVAALGLAAVIAVASLIAGGGFGFVVSGLIWAPLAATAFVRVAGRPAVEWVGTASHYGGRKASGQTDYRARITPPRPTGTLGLGGDAASLRFYLERDSGAAMIHDPHRQTLTAVVSVSHPAFVLLDRDNQAQQVSRWGRVLASLAQSGTLAACQVLEATVPDPGDGVADWYQARGMHNGGWADLQYRALLDGARLGSSTHRTTVSIALDMRAAARAIKAAGGGVVGAATVMGQDMASLADSLRQAGLTVGHWLAEPELASIVRHAYDPAVIIEPHTTATLAHAGPLAISEHWDHLRHDSGWSAVMWVSEWPRIDVPPDFLHPVIFAPGVRRTLSIIARPLPSETALRQLRKEKTEAVADQAQKARVGQIADLSDAQEYQDLIERERSVIAGHTDIEFTGFVTVTAPSLEGLEAARAVVMRAAGAAACEVRPLYGRQAQGFVLAALPLARAPF